MGEVVNLRQARKRAERTRKETEAEANRLSFGTPKAFRKAAERERERSAAELDGHRLSAEPGSSGRRGTPLSET